MNKYLTREEEYNLFYDWIDNKNIESRDKLLFSQQNFIYKECIKFCKSRNWNYCEDLFSETQIHVLEILHKFDPKSGNRLSSYLVRVVNFFFIKCYNLKSKQITLPQVYNPKFSKYFDSALKATTDIYKTELIKDYINPIDKIINKEEEEILYKNIQNLSEKEKKLIHDKFVLNKTYREIGSEYNLNHGTIQQRVKTIIGKLKNDN